MLANFAAGAFLVFLRPFKVGDIVTADWFAKVQLELIGSVAEFPSIDPGRPFVLVDRASLNQLRAARQLEPTEPNEWWLATTDEGVASVAEAALQAPISAGEVVTREDLTRSLQRDPIALGMVGSLLLGLYDDRNVLQHVGVTSAFTMETRAQLARELAPLRARAMENHPWREWAAAGGETTRMPGGQSRWSAGKDLSWEPLRIERVCEVKYDHLQGERFRHAAVFLRWRPDKPPAACRYDQLETTQPYELDKVFSSGSRGS